MFSHDLTKKIFFWQLIAHVVILLVCGSYTIAAGNIFNARQKNMIILGLIFGILELLLIRHEVNKNEVLRQASYYFSAVAVCYVLSHSLFLLTKLLSHFNLVNANVWMLLITLYTFVMYIPLARLVLSKISSNMGRIIVLAVVIFNNTIGIQGDIAGNLHYAKLFTIMNNSGVTGIPILIIITLIVMDSWHIKKPHFFFSSEVSVATSFFILLIIALHLAYIIYAITVNWFTFESAFKFYVSQIDWAVILNALRCGVAEEWINRFCIISLLAQIFANRKSRILLIMISDGLIFGFWHITNVFYQSLPATLLQMFTVSSMGMLFAAIYLYTHSLLTTMIYHGVYDLIVFVISKNFGTYGQALKRTIMLTSQNYYSAIIQFCVFLILGLIIISGKKHQKVIGANLTQI
ncbi:CPBP family intramembrane metalloprotease [Lactobacillus sp. ESL0731]|uniref:CPBP family intramembrane glutamic endopeptidase n=1 Tax=unclassified Lactobacillus TaxID=2620435 RepID=UPI0023F94A69|nr:MULTISPECIES: CPBP family intramembrane glutamic endopeptidase [unclassified Lactobacillus]WEV50768.1 CPBP family intramembrane metalloprotease [Lactobacillus sp. ESL0700]WEV61899.1 CPBP family intramembrane metalloprotease [Lactobacillus sp. ESL0731]